MKKRKFVKPLFRVGDRVKVTEEAIQEDRELSYYQGMPMIIETYLNPDLVEARSLVNGDVGSFNQGELEHVLHPAEVLLDEMAKVLRETSCKTAPRDCTNSCMDGICNCSGLFRYSDNVSDILKAYDEYKEGARI